MEKQYGYNSFTVFWIYTTLKQGRQAVNWGTVLLYSEFTLLSNTCRYCHVSSLRFTVFWIYTTLKQSALFHYFLRCFTVFWIYTTLKHFFTHNLKQFRFTVFWIYTTLKPQIWAEIDTQHYNCGKFISTTLLFYYNTFIFINNHYFLVFNLFADDIYCLYHDCHNN